MKCIVVIVADPVMQNSPGTQPDETQSSSCSGHTELERHNTVSDDPAGDRCCVAAALAAEGQDTSTNIPNITAFQPSAQSDSSPHRQSVRVSSLSIESSSFGHTAVEQGSVTGSASELDGGQTDPDRSSASPPLDAVDQLPEVESPSPSARVSSLSTEGPPSGHTAVEHGSGSQIDGDLTGPDHPSALSFDTAFTDGQLPEVESPPLPPPDAAGQHVQSTDAPELTVDDVTVTSSSEDQPEVRSHVARSSDDVMVVTTRGLSPDDDDDQCRRAETSRTSESVFDDEYSCDETGDVLENVGTVFSGIYYLLLVCTVAHLRNRR